MDATIIKFNGQSFKFWPRGLPDVSVMREIFKLREYRAATEAIKSAIEPILDAGAHAGFFSVYCRALNPRVKILALEPEARNRELMEKHFWENKVQDVKIIAGALAGKSGRRQLVVSADSHNHRLADENNSGEMAVKAYSLPDLCHAYKVKKLSLLKMDIEGAEFEVLENLTPADFKLFKTVILEYHNNKPRAHEDVEQILRTHGFSVQIFPSKFDKQLGIIFGVNKRIKE